MGDVVLTSDEANFLKTVMDTVDTMGIWPAMEKALKEYGSSDPDAEWTQIAEKLLG